MTALRSVSGCWTCRIRHKKCDERKPECHTCSSRSIPCHGYGKAPPWQNDREGGKAAGAQIKAAVKAHLKRKRLVRTEEADIRATISRSHSVDEVSGSPAPPYLDPDIPQGLFESEENSPLQAYDPAVVVESSTWDSDILEYRKSELLMHYFDHTFRRQFRFHNPNPNAGGRGWLLWLLSRTGPLYHAALSLSALHQYGMLGQNDGAKYTELVGYHAKALEDLQLFVQRIRESHKVDDLGQQIAILSCGVMLISFEVSGPSRSHRDSANSVLSCSAEAVATGGSTWTLLSLFRQ